MMPMPITDAMFLLLESREHPLHVGGLQLYDVPDGAGPDYVYELYRQMLGAAEAQPLYRQRPRRSLASFGQWGWQDDDELDLEYHVRLSALPRPGKVRQLLELVSRLHGSLLDRHRPLWEFHLIDGLEGNRYATYTKVHHALVDGASAVRQLVRMMTTDPDDLDCLPFWAARPKSRSHAVNGVDLSDRLSAVAGGVSDALGIGPAVVRTALRTIQEQAATLPFQAPKTVLNVSIGGARRFAAQSWSLDRIRELGKRSGSTVNDIALAMSAGALRRYLLELNALPAAPLVAMVPVSLRGARLKSDATGNAVGTILCSLATDIPDPAVRLEQIMAAMSTSKEMYAELTPLQITALSALMVGGVGLAPLPGITRLTPPPFNLIISNVPGPTEDMYFNGAKLSGTYPVSFLLDGQAMNITLTSHAGSLDFGIVGCRRSLPHLQHLLGHLDAALEELERAVS
ncbi:wax ester/triacylglycerol synthase family O-acyltransferase [Fodinicola feengrottensis]|uniref:Diacylglycerol O-acyltransferase n=1 Tax=Fodinicola feengrottensis TaxID=435914 RepID=A0ABN2FWN0_9ACTN